MAVPWTAPRPRPLGAQVPRPIPWELLPLVVTVLLLAVPLPAGASGGGLGPADFASGVLVLCCLARVLRTRSRPLTRTAALVVGAPAVAIALATVTAADPLAAVPGFVRYLQVFVLVPAAVVLLVRDARDFRAVTGALVVLALVQGAIGVHQYATGTGASYMGEDIRAVGTFGPTDVMGMATVVAYGLLASAALALRAPKGAPVPLRPAAAGAAVLLVVPLGLSFSRGAWIATAVAALAMLLLAGVRRALAVLAVTVAATVVLVGGFGVGSAMIGARLSSITQVTDAPDRSVTDRYTMWAAAESMWRENPLTGVGLKGFPDHRDSHATIGLSSGSDTAGAGQQFLRQPLLSPHNMYLLILSEQGLLGAVAFAGSWAALLVGGVRRLLVRRGALDCGLAAVALTLWQTVDFLYADIGGPSTVLTGVVFGLAARWALAPLGEPARPVSRPGPAGAAGVGVRTGDRARARTGAGSGAGSVG
ncbi:O-antigen ligase family protein [Streptomyces qinzhouensis]|uniref:O-antigen ligase family protein n=1 Tax=Streptomyces qinzhouensis TaxID=2599401 RepID=A0A5B8JER2_9ACTN|nr:O-antigen ligase family protein [Streptomyces qinzhouensis]QDY78744.1 O-antigen ligase family protein [Streptomyces qinzhouensis]